MLDLLGLVLIIAAWLMQFYHMKKKKDLRKDFVIIYGLGVAFLVIDGFSNGLWALALLNLISLVSAGLVLSRVKR